MTVSGRELVRLWLRNLMPHEPSPVLVNWVTERLRMAVNPGSRFPGDEPAEWAETEQGVEFKVLYDMLAVADDDEIAEHAAYLIEIAEKSLGLGS